MNDFLESFLMVFGKNKYTNLKRYWTNFCCKTDYSLWKIVNITNLVTMATKFDKVYLTKATSKALLSFTKNN